MVFVGEIVMLTFSDTEEKAVEKAIAALADMMPLEAIQLPGLGRKGARADLGVPGSNEIKFSQNTKKRRHTHFVMYRFCNQNCFKIS